MLQKLQQLHNSAMSGRGRGIQPPRSNVPPALPPKQSNADADQPHFVQDPQPPPRHEVPPAHVEGIGRISIGGGRGRKHHPGTRPGLLPRMGSDPFPGTAAHMLILPIPSITCAGGTSCCHGGRGSWTECSWSASVVDSVWGCAGGRLLPGGWTPLPPPLIALFCSCWLTRWQELCL